MNTKFVFITGGVVSGLGKGITAASLGRLLKSRLLSVTIQKFDPYLNIDPGTMNPYQHGEVFVTDDGAETDLDLGHYERFIDESLNQLSNVTSGKVYWSVLNKERKGDYLGGTVQVIPHITNEIKDKIRSSAEYMKPDVALIEIGGTVGDIESLPFLEAIRQFSIDVGRENCLFIHVTLVPQISASGELKSKPTQHSVKELLGIGIQPDIIVCRSEHLLPRELREKIGLFCNIPGKNVIQNLDMPVLYEIPLALEKEGLADIVCEKFKIRSEKPDLSEWQDMVDKIKSPRKSVEIALVGKYIALHDAYLSVAEALKHGGINNEAIVRIRWVDSVKLDESNINEELKGVDGILVPGGFGSRGIGGKILAAKYARQKKVPYLGICLGMQTAIIEFARNVLGLDADSSELNAKTPDPVIDLMPDQADVTDLGGTLRLGKYPCALVPGTRASAIYNTDLIYERHRHRYEVNNKYRDLLTQNGMTLCGLSPDNRIVEMVELSDHPFFVACQFHPEFKSRPNRPHPLFHSLIKAALLYKENKK